MRMDFLFRYIYGLVPAQFGRFQKCLLLRWSMQRLKAKDVFIHVLLCMRLAFVRVPNWCITYVSNGGLSSVFNHMGDHLQGKLEFVPGFPPCRSGSITTTPVFRRVCFNFFNMDARSINSLQFLRQWPVATACHPFCVKIRHRTRQQCWFLIYLWPWSVLLCCRCTDLPLEKD